MNDSVSKERSARYLQEVLLQPDQVDDVALNAAETESILAADDLEHPHGDY